MCDITEAFILHNDLRSLHGSPALKWNEACALSAQRHADHLMSTNSFSHSNLLDEEGRRVGQNLACAEKKHVEKGWGAVAATKLWYRERKRYDWRHPRFRKGYSHFTQMMWKESREVGIGMARTPYRVIVVANYYPMGNIEGAFKENITET